MPKNNDRPFFMYRCTRCNYPWGSSGEEKNIRVCPKCKSPYWNKIKKAKIADEEDMEF